MPLHLSTDQRDGAWTSTAVARYVSLFCSTLVALSAGSNYGFSSYSPQLQERLHLSSTAINVVGVMGNMGVYLSGPIWGRLVDRTGPRPALLIGALLVLAGYGGLSLSYERRIWQNTSLAFLSFLSLLSGLGNSAAFTAAMNAQAKSWNEERRGLCTALVLSGFGLAAFFYSTLSHTLFPGETGDYLLLLGLGSSISFLIGLAFIKVIPPDTTEHDPARQHNQPRPRVSSDAIVDDSDDNGEETLYRRPVKSHVRRRTSSDIGGRAWAYAAASGEEEHADVDRDATYGERADSLTRNDVWGQEHQGLLNGGHEQRVSHAISKNNVDMQAVDKTGFKLFYDVDFLLLFSIMTIISGTGLLIINNIGTMTRTLYEHNKHADTGIASFVLPYISLDAQAFRDGDVQQLQAHQVSAISVGNALGRILMGLCSDLVVNYSGHPRNRVYMLLLVCTLAIASQGLAAWPGIIRDLKKLFGMSAVTGLMYGTLFGLCPVLTFEWFGLRHFSQNWGIVSLSPVIAGNTFNLLFGKIYDSHVPKDGHTHICPDGEECFRSVFQFTALGAVLALILSGLLIARRVRRLGHTATTAV